MKTAMATLKTNIEFLKDHKKEMFWTWIAYQFVKGTLTTSFIWIPLLIALFA